MHDLDLQVLMDKQSITERLLDYARGVDRIDRELIRSFFHEAAYLDYGAMFVGTREEFADFIGEVHPAMEAHSHHLSNIYITVDGDRAGSETYVLARLRSKGPHDTLSDTVTSGRYIDQWVRQRGEWRIIHRRYLHSMDSTEAAVASGYPAAGDRTPSDPSYAVLALGFTEGA